MSGDRVARADDPPPDWTGAVIEAGPPALRLELWDRVLFGRYLAIDGMVRKYARYYDLPSLWMVLPFASESILNPLAKGPQDDDRGIGQVGYAAEKRGRVRGSNPESRDYHPDVHRTASVWDPRTNILFALILFRWVYEQPYVTSPEKAYAVYTDGLNAILPDGSISEAAQRDVDRAASYTERVLAFMATTQAARGLKGDRLARLIPHPITRQMVLIDRQTGDGQRTYAGLRDLYLREASLTGNPWVLMTYAREALTYADLAERVYASDATASYEALRDILVRQRDLAVSDPALRGLYHQTLDAVRERLK